MSCVAVWRRRVSCDVRSQADPAVAQAFAHRLGARGRAHLGQDLRRRGTSRCAPRCRARRRCRGWTGPCRAARTPRSRAASAARATDGSCIAQGCSRTDRPSSTAAIAARRRLALDAGRQLRRRATGAAHGDLVGAAAPMRRHRRRRADRHLPAVAVAQRRGHAVGEQRRRADDHDARHRVRHPQRALRALGHLQRQRLRTATARDAEFDLRAHLQALAHALRGCPPARRRA